MELLSLALWSLLLANNPQPHACTLNNSELPAVRTFKMGMTARQVIAKYPKLAARHLQLLEPDQNGLRKLSLDRGDFHEYIPTADTKGLESIKIAFLDGRIASLQINYDGFTEWDSVDEFVAALSKALGLPEPSKWATADNQVYKIRRLACAESVLEAKLLPSGGSKYFLQQPTLTFTDRTLETSLNDREETKKARQRKIFKP